MATSHLPAISYSLTRTRAHTEGRLEVLYFVWVHFKSQKSQKATTRLCLRKQKVCGRQTAGEMYFNVNTSDLNKT